ncbi:Phosphoglycerate dehydrogenase [Celeribacter baekdonensis]|uniref:Phosphoglycerate dehydrogenase n=1 Tax=Celeribacter baekdonensis TaxID=875171 RepID=A0A1G7S064_9RHOB|nr:NAD(P)-dependent oxidoreductase [Celeribacter baekdonensis]SDG16422.1 Phosphoglycerate dehydrogenase [Celeribacter baekdonensis]
MTGPVVVQQISESFGEALRAHASNPQVIDHLDRDRPWDFPQEAEALVTYPYPSWLSEAGRVPQPRPGLKWVQLFSAGVERFPEWLLDGRMVGCGRGQTSPQIAEFVLAAMLNREKRLNEISARSLTEWVRPEMGTLVGKTLGLIGYGSIGAEIARRALAFDMQIVACRNSPWAEVPKGLTPLAGPAEVLAQSDHAAICVPLTDETRGMVDDAFLAQAKPGLHLINIARGAILDQDALLRAIAAGRIAHATLDVTFPEPLPETHPLWQVPEVHLTPHVSFLGGDHLARFLEKTLANLTTYAQGAPLRDLFDRERGY